MCLRVWLCVCVCVCACVWVDASVLWSHSHTRFPLLCTQTPNRRAALVTFNGDVSIYGDGGGAPRVLTGDRLTQYDHLLAAGTEYAVDRCVCFRVCVCVRCACDVRLPPFPLCCVTRHSICVVLPSYLRVCVCVCLRRNVGVSGDALVKAVFELEETGPTALGPAVLTAVAMASRSPGSKVGHTHTHTLTLRLCGCLSLCECVC